MVAAANNSVPTGTVMIWTQEIIPEGWLECNGQPVNPTFSLYKIMTKTPDYRNIFLQGANGNLGQKIEAGLPNIKGTASAGEVTGLGNVASTLNGPFYQAEKYPRSLIGDPSFVSFALGFDASLSNPLYGKSNTVQPPAVTVKYIIKCD